MIFLNSLRPHFSSTAIGRAAELRPHARKGRRIEGDFPAARQDTQGCRDRADAARRRDGSDHRVDSSGGRTLCGGRDSAISRTRCRSRRRNWSARRASRDGSSGSTSSSTRFEALDAIESFGFAFDVFLKVDCGYHRAGVDPDDPGQRGAREAGCESKTCDSTDC